MKAVLIIDNELKLRNWQLQALNLALDNGLEIVSIYVNNSKGKVRIKRKFLLYYVFLVPLRNRLKILKNQNIDLIKLGNPRITEFNSVGEGNWSKFPLDVWQETEDIDIVIKFDSSLMRDADQIPVKYGVLSYHHGDPSSFRGRPVAFWEMYKGVPEIGVGIQLIGNKLDAGIFVSIARTRCASTSYLKSIESVYEIGVEILNQALLSIQNTGKPTKSVVGTSGDVYSLPSNFTVIKYGLKLLGRFSKRIVYGLFIEKRWWIGEIQGVRFNRGMNFISSRDVKKIPPPKSSRFVADPMLDISFGLFCEVMKRPRYKGQIWRFKEGQWKRVQLDLGFHFSYPQILPHSNELRIFPESSQDLPPSIYQLDPTSLKVIKKQNLPALENQRLIDATLFKKGDIWFLFANSNVDGFTKLRLWTARDLLDDFIEHPNSPISQDIRNRRMAGSLILENGILLRFGQNNLQGYGQSITIMKITALSEKEYSEEHYGEVALRDCFGPHTMTFSDNTIVLDGYAEKFSLFAGLRRILNKL